MSTIHATDLRAAMGRFATGVAVVTAMHPELGPFGSTANSVSSVSLEPPLVLVCLKRESETLAALDASGAFAVNVLAEDQLSLADRFAKAGAAWDGVAHEPGETGSPLLDGTLASVECELYDLADGGDHRIVVGRVLGLRDASEPHPPLLFAGSRYHGLGDAISPEVDLPSRLGDLRVTVRDWGEGITLVATKGRPRGTAGADLYVHQGCLVGDLLGSCCDGRARLHEAVSRLEQGVVVYHRPETALCSDTALRPSTVKVVLEAAAELRLRTPRLLNPEHREQLTTAGLDLQA